MKRPSTAEEIAKLTWSGSVPMVVFVAIGFGFGPVRHDAFNSQIPQVQFGHVLRQQEAGGEIVVPRAVGRNMNSVPVGNLARPAAIMLDLNRDSNILGFSRTGIADAQKEHGLQARTEVRHLDAVDVEAWARCSNNLYTGKDDERQIGIIWRPWCRLALGGIFLSLGLLIAYRSEFGGYLVYGFAYFLVVVGLTGLFWESLWSGIAPHWLWLL